jgi:hypothetical protein
MLPTLEQLHPQSAVSYPAYTYYFNSHDSITVFFEPQHIKQLYDSTLIFSMKNSGAMIFR